MKDIKSLGSLLKNDKSQIEILNLKNVALKNKLSKNAKSLKD